MITYLPYPTAKRLHDAGIVVESDYAYLTIEGKEAAHGGPYPRDMEACKQVAISARDRGFVPTVTPAPTLSELLAILPSELKIGDSWMPISIRFGQVGYINPEAGLKCIYIHYIGISELTEACGLLALALKEKGIGLEGQTEAITDNDESGIDSAVGGVDCVFIPEK